MLWPPFRGLKQSHVLLGVDSLQNQDYPEQAKQPNKKATNAHGYFHFIEAFVAFIVY